MLELQYPRWFFYHGGSNGIFEQMLRRALPFVEEPSEKQFQLTCRTNKGFGRFAPIVISQWMTLKESRQHEGPRVYSSQAIGA